MSACEYGRWWPIVLMPCRALEAFGQIAEYEGKLTEVQRLNALSGIGGVRTIIILIHGTLMPLFVLMPCRALEAFGR